MKEAKHGSNRIDPVGAEKSQQVQIKGTEGLVDPVRVYTEAVGVSGKYLKNGES